MNTPSKRTVTEAAEAFIEGIEKARILSRKGKPYKPSVRRAYTTDLRRYVTPELGAMRLSAIRRADVQAFVDQLVADGESPTRIHGIVMPLRAICRRAIERDEIVVNPTANVRLPAAVGVRERVATPVEAETLFGVLTVEDRALWGTAFYAGPRRGELRGLRWSAINLAENVIEITRSWDDVEGPVDPKSEKGKRRVPIASELRRLLIEHKMRTGRDGDDLVFGSTATQPFTPTNMSRRADRAWAAASVEREREGLPPLQRITLQELRHSYVSWMHDAGVSLEQIGDYVGHSSAYMTERYRHMLDGHEGRTVERANAYLRRAMGEG